jgi:predicted acetyltransferase
MTSLEPIAASEREVLWRYLQLYCYVMSEFTGARPVDGVFQYSRFEEYWQAKTERSAFWVKHEGDVAGFALVRLDRDDGRREVAEFFIVNRWQRQGVGSASAHLLFRRFPGAWKLHQLANNIGAIAFWRRVIGELVTYTEAPLVYRDGSPRIEQRFLIC